MDQLYCLCQQPYNASLFYIACDGCDSWFHGECVGVDKTLARSLDKYYCPDCQAVHGPPKKKPRKSRTTRSLTTPTDHATAVSATAATHEENGTARKRRATHGGTVEPARRSARERSSIDYKALESGERNPNELRKDKWLRWINQRERSGRFVSAVDAGVALTLRGQELTVDWVRRNGWSRPIIVLSKEGLDMDMPASLTAAEVAEQVGPLREVEAIYVPTQTETTFTLQEWAEYYASPVRDNVYNVISLEVSHTQLGARIRRPRVVRELDWVDTIWPPHRKSVSDYWPKVQLYCLMSVKHSYTDFHIDFGGSSVFYHVIHGSKTFYFIPPTDDNLKTYQTWMLSADQPNMFLGDLVDTCYQVHLKAGHTMMIPSGWIHAVYTPTDSMVIGGNFLTSYTIPMQLRIFDIETKTLVPTRFRYSQFELICWMAAEHYLAIFRHEPDALTLTEVVGLERLGSYLAGRIRQLLAQASVKLQVTLSERHSALAASEPEVKADVKEELVKDNDSAVEASSPLSSVREVDRSETSTPVAATAEGGSEPTKATTAEDVDATEDDDDDDNGGGGGGGSSTTTAKNKVKPEAAQQQAEEDEDELLYIADSVPEHLGNWLDRYRGAVDLATQLTQQALRWRVLLEQHLSPDRIAAVRHPAYDERTHKATNGHAKHSPPRFKPNSPPASLYIAPPAGGEMSEMRRLLAVTTTTSGIQQQ
ncbi:JmjC domain-containing histone demethylation protein 1 [Sorochytrium milnesiophthora]